jgi:voltage-gated potassium channel
MFISRAKKEVESWFVYPPEGKARWVEGILFALIAVVCTLPVVLAYTDNPTLVKGLRWVEVVITSIFLVEYLLRLWVAENRWRHVLQPHSVVDFVAILPLFLPGTYLQMLRVFRLLRILRFIRYLRGPHFFFGSTSMKNLIVVRIFFTLLAIIFVSAGLVFYAERGAEGSHFQTYADAVYFSIVTMATVGYGDITPVTNYGRWMTVLIIFGGIVLLPWQIKDLIEHLFISHNKREVSCPSCDLTPHEPDSLFCRRCGAALPPPKRGQRTTVRMRAVEVGDEEESSREDELRGKGEVS